MSFGRFLLVVLLFCIASALPAQSVLSTAARKIQSGDAAGAVSMLEIYVRNTPEDATAWNLLGIAETERGNGASADAAFSRALKLQPHSAAIAENFGSSLYRRGEFQRAKPYLETAVAQQKKPGVALQLALARLKTGEEKTGFQNLLDLENSFREHPLYWEERGIAEAARKSFEAAARSLDRSIELNARSPRALAAGAAVAEQQGLDEKAIAYLLKARALDPKHPGLALAFGRVCLRRDLGQDAVAALEQAYAAMPENLEAIYALAAANVAVEKYESAHELLLEFVQRAPTHPTAHYSLGWLSVKLNRPAEARKKFERALQLAPEFTSPLLELAELDYRDGILHESKARALRVTKLDPGSGRAWMLLGDLAQREGNLPEAQALYEKSIEANEDLGAAHAKLARVLFRLGDQQGAEREQKLSTEANERAKQQRRRELRLAGMDGLGPR